MITGQDVFLLLKRSLDKFFSNELDKFYIIPRRVSQDNVENSFARIRLAAAHGRLDHRTTAGAVVKTNVMKEVKRSERCNNKRNSGEINTEEGDVNANGPESLCTEYATQRYDNGLKMRNEDFVSGNPFVWTEKNGKLFLFIPFH